MDDISRGVANTLQPARKYIYKNNCRCNGTVKSKCFFRLLANLIVLCEQINQRQLRQDRQTDRIDKPNFMLMIHGKSKWRYSNLRRISENICTSLEHFSMIIKNVLHHRELIFYSPTSAKLTSPQNPKKKTDTGQEFLLPNTSKYI